MFNYKTLTAAVLVASTSLASASAKFKPYEGYTDGEEKSHGLSRSSSSTHTGGAATVVQRSESLDLQKTLDAMISKRPTGVEEDLTFSGLEGEKLLTAAKFVQEAQLLKRLITIARLKEGVIAREMEEERQLALIAKDGKRYISIVDSLSEMFVPVLDQYWGAPFHRELAVQMFFKRSGNGSCWLEAVQDERFGSVASSHMNESEREKYESEFAQKKAALDEIFGFDVTNKKSFQAFISRFAQWQKTGLTVMQTLKSDLRDIERQEKALLAKRKSAFAKLSRTNPEKLVKTTLGEDLSPALGVLLTSQGVVKIILDKEVSPSASSSNSTSGSKEAALKKAKAALDVDFVRQAKELDKERATVLKKKTVLSKVFGALEDLLDKLHRSGRLT